MKKILVVVDMQNDFITGPLGNEECEAVVPNVVRVINEGDYERIFVTFDTHEADYLKTNEGRHLPVEHCLFGSEGWGLNNEVLKAVTDALAPNVSIVKNSFGSLELGAMLQELFEKGEDVQIDFVGVCTGICVISNAMIAKAACPEADIRVIKDACACVTPESHETALAAMQLCQIEIV